MCFIIRSETVDIDTKLFPRMQFLENIPSALKVEEEIYNLLDHLRTSDTLQSALQGNDISTYEFLISRFPTKQAAPTNRSDATDWGTLILHKLQSYALDDLLGFYWRVGTTTTPEDVSEEEKQRVEQWAAYANTLSEQPPDTDPCGLNALSITTFDVSIYKQYLPV